MAGRVALVGARPVVPLPEATLASSSSRLPSAFWTASNGMAGTRFLPAGFDKTHLEGGARSAYSIKRFCPPLRFASARSEEHTSELQSRFELVCRLLLEKQ